MLADEIHRAHQRCTQAAACDPLLATQDLVFEAGASTMRMLQGAYSCLCLVKSVGLVAFRDPFGIRCGAAPGSSSFAACAHVMRMLWPHWESHEFPWPAAQEVQRACMQQCCRGAH